MNLAPVNLVPVQFYEDTIDALPLDGKVWVSLRECCESLGLDTDTQRKKLKKQAWACTVIMTVQSRRDDQQRPHVLIDLESLPMWLATVNAGKVKEELRPKLVRYQKEAARVLAEHFLNRPKPPVPLGPYTRRALLANRMAPMIPNGFWCVFIESARFLFGAEHVFAPAGLEMEADDLLDGSIGQRWARFRVGKFWAKPHGTYPHAFPDDLTSGRAGKTFPAKCYRDEELLRFRHWLDREYAATDFQEYIRRKYGNDGLRKALPHVTKVFALPEPSLN